MISSHLPCHNLFFPLKPVSVNAVKEWRSLTEQLLETLYSLLCNAQPQASAIVLTLSSLGVFLYPLLPGKWMEGWRDIKSKGLQGGWVPAFGVLDLLEHLTSCTSTCMSWTQEGSARITSRPLGTEPCWALQKWWESEVGRSHCDSQLKQLDFSSLPSLYAPL